MYKTDLIQKPLNKLIYTIKCVNFPLTRNVTRENETKHTSAKSAYRTFFNKIKVS